MDIEVKKFKRSSVRKAWIKLNSRNPQLIEEALRRGLQSKTPIQYLELGSKLMKEVGAQEESAAKVVIVFNSPVDPNKLRGQVIEVQKIENV